MLAASYTLRTAHPPSSHLVKIHLTRLHLPHCQSPKPRLGARHFAARPAAPSFKSHFKETYKYPPLRYQVQAIDRSTLVIGLALALATAAAYSFTRPASEASEENAESTVWKNTAESYALTMAPVMPPGRPGNLTAEQEAKLKEMWTALLDICGVQQEAPEADVEGEGNGGAAPTTPDGKKKRHKSRLSMFRRDKNKGGDGVGSPGGALDAENDKHGQSKEYAQALASLTPEQLRDVAWSMVKFDHPDALLLRFLRARKWDVHAAMIMMVSTMHWRSQDMHVDDDILVHGEEGALRDSKSDGNGVAKKEGADFLQQLRLGKSLVHGLDKENRPCCYVRVRLHRQGEQSERSLERFTVYIIETTRMMLRPPVDTATLVFDMTDFSMANMDYTPVKFMIKCFEANYPESLGSVLVYRAPWIFHGIWKIIRGWLDPVVAGKVHFASNVEELEEWIPRSQIMRELGGDEDYVYSYVEPVEGENAELGDKAAMEKVQAERTELMRSYESETLAWIHGDDDGAGRNRLAERLAENYWRLDPNVRARSMYDRTGVIGRGGKLDFYPRPSSTQTATANGGGEDELD